MAGGVATTATRAARRRRRSSGQISEINVTPFVDVMLVLLIIFMVAAPLLTVGVPLELPESEAQPLPTEQEEPLTINLDAAGGIFIQNVEIGEDELIAKLTAIQETRESEQIFLRADRSLDYGRVMRVMGALNAGGFTKIGLVTDQATPEDR